METRTVAVILLALLSAFLFMNFSAPQTLVKSNATAFNDEFSAANKVSVLMDLRNSTYSSSSAILQCGVDIAGSINIAAAQAGLVEKNVSVFVMDGSGCITESGNRTVYYCDELMRSGITIHLKHGIPDISYYKSRMVIKMQEYVSACTVSLKSPNSEQNSTQNSSG